MFVFCLNSRIISYKNIEIFNFVSIKNKKSYNIRFIQYPICVRRKERTTSYCYGTCLARTSHHQTARKVLFLILLLVQSLSSIKHFSFPLFTRMTNNPPKQAPFTRQPPDVSNKIDLEIIFKTLHCNQNECQIYSFFFLQMTENVCKVSLYQPRGLRQTKAHKARKKSTVKRPIQTWNVLYSNESNNGNNKKIKMLKRKHSVFRSTHAKQ